MTQIKFKYIAENSADLDSMAHSLKAFSDSYILEGYGSLLVSKSLNVLSISPDNSELSSIRFKDGKELATILRASAEFVEIKLNGQAYRFRYSKQEEKLENMLSSQIYGDTPVYYLPKLIFASKTELDMRIGTSTYSLNLK